MAEHTLPAPRPSIWSRIDKAWAAIALILVAVAVLDPPQFLPTVGFGLNALVHTAPFILFAVLAVGFLKATGAESLLAKAFEGREARMVVMAALLGGLSPFCSCEVIPFIAALLAVGAPLSAVMAFWLSSPLMDPAMFLITAGTLGADFAIAKNAVRRQSWALGRHDRLCLQHLRRLCRSAEGRACEKLLWRRRLALQGQAGMAILART